MHGTFYKVDHLIGQKQALTLQNESVAFVYANNENDERN